MKYLFLLMTLTLAACGPIIKRDIDVEGNFPRAIGAGSFGSSCIFICFVTTTFEQGDIHNEDVKEGNRKTSDEMDIKLNGLHRKEK